MNERIPTQDEPHPDGDDGDVELDGGHDETHSEDESGGELGDDAES
jgi:hypothetical protein